MTSSAPAALLHALDALVPARDDLAWPSGKENGCAAVPRGVELLAVLEEHARVLDVDGLAGGRLRAGALLEVLEGEARGRGRARWGP